MCMFTHIHICPLLSWLGIACRGPFLTIQPWQPWWEGVCSWPFEILGSAASPVSWKSQVRVWIPHGWGGNSFCTSHISTKCSVLQVMSIRCWSSVAVVQCLVLDAQRCWYTHGWEQVCARQLVVWTGTFPHMLLLIRWGNAQFWVETPSELRYLQIWGEVVNRHCQ